jgi:hypothetical protein
MEHITHLNRRTGFFVRQRARAGLLPGEVSTTARLRARDARNVALFVLVLMLVGFPLVLVGISLIGQGSEWRPTLIGAVVGPDEGEQYEVLFADGGRVTLDEEPPVDEGDVVLTYGRSERNPIGFYHEGVTYEGIRSSSLVSTLIVVGLVAAAVAVPLSFSATWANRALRSIKADLDQPLQHVSGKYLGSWTWQGIANRLAGNRSNVKLDGFPIALRLPDGNVAWFGAPLGSLENVVRFEESIATGEREVIVHYHPNSRAVARIESVRADITLEVDHELDELRPSTGLTLKIGRREDLPDR